MTVATDSSLSVSLDFRCDANAECTLKLHHNRRCCAILKTTTGAIEQLHLHIDGIREHCLTGVDGVQNHLCDWDITCDDQTELRIAVGNQVYSISIVEFEKTLGWR